MRGYYWLQLHLRRDYKDRLFCYIFRDKNDLLDLYNAIQGTNYTNPDDFQVVTMEDVIYMKMQNDISFIIGGKLNLYEHQSTLNYNMPLRGLFYFSQQYQGILSKEKSKIYQKKMIKIPTPEYIVFYNGPDEMDEESELYLSDAFHDGRGSGCLECKCRVLNINRGQNAEIMSKCKRLADYSEFTSTIQEYRANGCSNENAVQAAIDDCIERGILSDILSREKTEVIHMILTEYNEKKHMKYVYEDGLMDGRRATYQELIHAMISSGKTPEEIAAFCNIPLDVVRDYTK